MYKWLSLFTFGMYEEPNIVVCKVLVKFLGSLPLCGKCEVNLNIC